jgi:hypothetical protein
METTVSPSHVWRRYLPRHLCESVLEHRPFEAPQRLNEGDIVLIRTHNVVGWWVRFGQGLSRSYRENGYSIFCHVAIAVDERTIAEADHRGVTINDLYEEYGNCHFVVLALDLEGSRRRAATAYVTYRAQSRTGYAFLTGIVVALRTWFRLGLVLEQRRAVTCSQLVAQALAQAGVILPRDAADMLPADFARVFELRLSKGFRDSLQVLAGGWGRSL